MATVEKPIVPEETNNEATPTVEPAAAAQTTTEEVVNPTAESESPAPEEAKPEEAPAAEKAEEAPAAEKAEEAATEPEEHEAERVRFASKEEVIEALRDIAKKDGSEITAEEVQRLRHLFFTFRSAEQAAEKEAFVAGGGDAESFEPTPCPVEEEMKELIAAIKESKAKARNELEAQREANLQRKKEIIKTIQEISLDTDNVNRHFQRVKELQAEFKEVGEVSPEAQANIWKEYQDSVERYYDQLKINKELRDYDFRKNLSDKQLLIEEAEKLADEEDVIKAFNRLQALHDKWREIGPVAKEVREEIWMKFKDASAVINKRHQAHFEERKAREQENEAAKTAICERVEALDFSGLRSYSAWDAMTKEIIAAQEDWKKLGFASKKMNNALFARFRSVCDNFFAAKAEFFKAMKDELAANLAKKIELCERAEALSESREWKKTTDELIALQKEWKTVGAVAKKHSDNVWRRFLAACDKFFDEKKKATSGVRQTEQANLKLKKELIESLNNLAEDTSREDALQAIRDARARWQEIGHVPFKEKDSIYDVFRKAINSVYERFDIRESRARMAAFESNVSKLEGDDNKLYRERERLVRACEQRRAELHTIENNMGFFNSKSKAGDSMIREMERKIERIKEDIATLVKKIEVIDSKL